MTTSSDTPETPRWLHWWTVLTVCATVCLLLIGAKVTTIKAGMAETEWPTHFLHLFSPSRDSADYLIEHSHRFAGYIVGMCSIVLAVCLWLFEKRRWLCWLGTLALAGVSLQGVLGGLRVLFNVQLGPVLAAVHGCFAQLVFALLVSLVLFTSRWWNEGGPLVKEDAWPNLRRWSLIACAALYLQIVFGAILRHTIQYQQMVLSQRLHLLGAFLAVACLIWLVMQIRSQGMDPRLRRLSTLVVLLLVVQMGLGIEAWLNRFGAQVQDHLAGPPVSLASGMTRTLHFVFGSLLFATTVTLTLLVRRRPRAIDTDLVRRRDRVLEGIA